MTKDTLAKLNKFDINKTKMVNSLTHLGWVVTYFQETNILRSL